MTKSLTDAFFEDDTEDGKFTLRLFEDPLREGELKLEVTDNSGIITVRPELDSRLALRLTNALWAWYATDEMLADSSTFDNEEY